MIFVTAEPETIDVRKTVEETSTVLSLIRTQEHVVSKTVRTKSSNSEVGMSVKLYNNGH